MFEHHIVQTHKRTPAYGLLERSPNNPDDYLDLYVHYEWLGWQAALKQTVSIRVIDDPAATTVPVEWQ
jgi:hypothetical protein